MSVAIYVLHPTSSLVFFLCILAGVLLGSLAMKWAREVIIVGTSLMGGAMAGVSAAKLEAWQIFHTVFFSVSDSPFWEC